MLNCIIESCKFKKEKVYINTEHIDEYVDKFFIVNCPKNASV